MTVALRAGLRRRRSRERRAQAAERLGMLLAQQEMETRLAVAEERSRIAREVHDVVGHSLAVIAMQAEGARAVLSRDPARADAAMAVIGTTSRAAVEEVRALVDVLRSDEERRDGVPTAPGERAAAAAPGHDHGDGGPDAGSTGPESLDALVPLVAGLRGAGVRVGLRLSLGEETRVGSAVEDCLVRVAREAVTNALHHAEGARLALRVTASGATAEVEVLNGPGGRDALPSTGRAGTGLASMRERVEAMGGLLEAGPVEDGGWRVRARVPVTGTTGAGGRA